LEGCDQDPRNHPEIDTYIHTTIVLNHVNGVLELNLAALLHDIGKPDTRIEDNGIHFYEHQYVGRDIAEKILKRLVFPKETIDKVCWLIEII